MDNRHGVIFDLDGTLVDTLGDLADATNRALQKQGYPPCPEEKYRQMVGNGAAKLIERALGEAYTEERTQAVLAEFIRIYDENCLVRTRPYEGIPELLAELAARGMRLAVLTNKPEKQARKIVAHYFGQTPFSFVYGGHPERKKKPDPTAVLEIMTAWQMPAENALFIGDSDVDIYTAKNAGIRSAGALWGFRGEEELRRAGADILLQKPMELLNFT